MKRFLLALAAAAPLWAAAHPHPEYSRVVIVERPVYPARLYVCNFENDRLWDRNALIDRDKRDLELERQDIERVRALLNEELARLDKTDTAAVAAYNARSNALNGRVDSLNRRVADVNGAVALLNADSRDLVSYCDRLYVARR